MSLLSNDSTTLTPDSSMLSEFILSICQILCFPFAIEPNDQVLTRMYTIIKEFNLFVKICDACARNAAELTCCDIPISLIARLTLTDDDLVQLLIEQLNNSKQVSSNLFYFWKFIVFENI